MVSYSPGEVSKLLNIPGSSLRRYVSRFPQAFSEEAKRLRGRRFTTKDFDILAQIKDYLAQGILLDEIGKILANTIDEQPATDQRPPAEEEPRPQTALALINTLSERLDKADRQRREAEAEQTAEIATLRTRLEALEAHQQAAQDQAGQAWYKRLVKRIRGEK